MREHARRWVLCAALALVALVALPQSALAGTRQVWRLYNRYNGDHMWTLDRAEYDSLVKAGWTGEGGVWQVPDEKEALESLHHGFVYRLYNPWSGEHLFTIDKAEYDRLGKAGWRKEGRAFESAYAGAGAPVWRLYNRWLTAGTHLYTTDKAEYDRLVRLGWTGEGVRFCAKPPESRLKRLTGYCIASNSLVGGDPWGSSLSTGVSLSIRGDALTLTPRGDRALLLKAPYHGEPFIGGSESNRTIINSAGELAGGRLSFRLTESTTYFLERESSADMVYIFKVVGRKEFEEERQRSKQGDLKYPYGAVVVDAQGNVVSLCMFSEAIDEPGPDD